MIRIPTSSVQDNGSSLSLMLMPSDKLIAEQMRIVSAVQGQVPIKDLHVTLMQSMHSGAALPLPPQFVELVREARLVTDGDKSSVYLPASSASQLELMQYLTSIERASNSTGIQNKDRVFHVSLTNLTGIPGESIANVWEYVSHPV